MGGLNVTRGSKRLLTGKPRDARSGRSLIWMISKLALAVLIRVVATRSESSADKTDRDSFAPELPVRHQAPSSAMADMAEHWRLGGGKRARGVPKTAEDSPIMLGGLSGGR